ncbi:MAG: acetate--CoA ligase family protein [Candidatus Helarchaeota archaeon]
MTISKFEKFEKFFNPKSIAVYGASKSFMRFGSFNTINLIIGGYKGKIYPIHPKYDTIMGLKAYKSILDIPNEIDMVCYVAPIKVLADEIMEEIGRKGVKNVIVVSAGADEIGNYEISRKLKNIVEKYNITMLGPNCIGLIVPKSKIYMSPMPIYHPPGNISIISQSGSVAAHILLGIKQIPFRLARVISVGNCLTTDLTDCLEALEDDPETKFIGLYIEGIRRGKKFIEVAKRVALKKPIVAIEIGQSEAGKRAALSHTAAISTPSNLFSHICHQTGIIQVENTIEWLNTLYAMSAVPLPKGPRVGVVTIGGGPGTLIADLCEKYGLKVPLLSEKTQEIIKNKYLPVTGSSKNPVDITFDTDWSNFFKNIPKTLLESGEVDAIIFYGIFSTNFWVKVIEDMPDHLKGDDLFKSDSLKEMESGMSELYHQNFRALRRMIKKYQIPVIMTGYNDRPIDDGVTLAREYGIPVFYPAEGAKIMANLWNYNKWKQNILKMESKI